MGENVSIRYLRLGAKYLSLALINLYDVAVMLEEAGYRLLQRLPPPGFRRGLGGRGPIAARGAVVVDVDTERHVLGVAAPDPELLVSEFDAVEEALSRRLRGYTRPRFYEVLAEVEVSVDGVDFYRQLGGIEAPPVSAIAEVLESDACLIGLRVGMSGARPEDDEWLEVEVTPSPTKSNDTLYISVLYRSRDKGKATGLVRKIPKLALAITNSLL